MMFNCLFTTFFCVGISVLLLHFVVRTAISLPCMINEARTNHLLPGKWLMEAFNMAKFATIRHSRKCVIYDKSGM